MGTGMRIEMEAINLNDLGAVTMYILGIACNTTVLDSTGCNIQLGFVYNLDKLITRDKCIISNARYAFADGHALELCTCGECIVSNARNAIRNGHGHDISTTREGISTDACYVVSNRYADKACAIFKRVISNSGDRQAVIAIYNKVYTVEGTDADDGIALFVRVKDVLKLNYVIALVIYLVFAG